jgi:hypothetical protein
MELKEEELHVPIYVRREALNVDESNNYTPRTV